MNESLSQKCPKCGFELSKPDWRCPECYHEFEDYTTDTDESESTISVTSIKKSINKFGRIAGGIFGIFGILLIATETEPFSLPLCLLLQGF